MQALVLETRLQRPLKDNQSYTNGGDLTWDEEPPIDTRIRPSLSVF